MKKLIYFTLSLCALVAVMTSCSSKADNELIGKWKQTIENGGAKVVSIYDFKDGGKLTQTFELKNDNPAIDIEAEGDCEYTFEGNVITFKFSATDFNFSKFEYEGLTDDMIEIAMDQMKSQMVNVEQEFTNVKINGDKLTAEFNGQEVELKRM